MYGIRNIPYHTIRTACNYSKAPATKHLQSLNVIHYSYTFSCIEFCVYENCLISPPFSIYPGFTAHAASRYFRSCRTSCYRYKERWCGKPSYERWSAVNVESVCLKDMSTSKHMHQQFNGHFKTSGSHECELVQVMLLMFEHLARETMKCPLFGPDRNCAKS